ncbi:MAG: hypothetical protein JXR48_15535 [Candidatus Delongbacteria bacterium]|nr:hypothetical protein [Candidatus Delongbacteria bacterium]MBN2836368.1 hypothetical protein [Candidatus Delongbacteria bacterium]
MKFTKKKFEKLPYKTRCNRLADSLRIVRDDLIENRNVNLNDLKDFTLLIFDLEDMTNIFINLQSILTEDDSRVLLEKIHYLYIYLKEETGFSDSEKQYIQIKNDTTNKNITTYLVLILENIRSSFNVGSIIRSAECFGVKQVILCGITPGVENNSVKKTAKNTENHVEIIRENLNITIATLKDDGYMIYGAEKTTGSNKLTEFSFPKKTAIILGNEEIGINQETISLCDGIIEIPLVGNKNSLNVASAASIMIYEYNRQVIK